MTRAGNGSLSWVPPIHASFRHFKASARNKGRGVSCVMRLPKAAEGNHRSPCDTLHESNGKCQYASMRWSGTVWLPAGRYLTVGLLAAGWTWPGLARDGDRQTRFSLGDALVSAYQSNPQLLRERALLRQTDEGVPQALAGWHPSVTVNAGANYTQSSYVTYPLGGAFRYHGRFDAPGYYTGVTVSQPLFMGGKTVASTRQAKDTVLHERAHLLTVEQQVFSDVTSAFVGLFQAQRVLELTRHNEEILANQVQLTSNQLGLNQATRTDVLQAASQYEGAQAATRQAESDRAVADTAFQRVVGIPAPENLDAPQPLILPFAGEQDAILAAAANNPQVVDAQYTLAADQDAVKVAFAALLPQISAQGSYQRQVNQQESKITEGVWTATIQADIPLYQGGAEYAAVRAARHAAEAAQRDLDDQKRAAVQQTTSAWRKLQSDRDQLVRNRAAVKLGDAALVAVQKQQLLGVRTTFDVLQQQQILFQQQKNLVQNVANLVQDSYAVASGAGRLTARDLALPTTIYDPTQHFEKVKSKWIGTE